MKKIGFIDYFIDEWHANNYPRMIRESSFKGEFDVALAWDMIKKDGKKPIDAFPVRSEVGAHPGQPASAPVRRRLDSQRRHRRSRQGSVL